MILDTYSCKQCGKKVVLKGDSKYKGVIDRLDLDCLCRECFNNNWENEEIKEEIEYEFNIVQGSC